MKRKIITLFALVFLLCGCNAEVDLIIDKNTIDETIKINDFVSEQNTKEMIFSSYREFIPVDSSIMIVDTEPDEKKYNVDYYKRSFTDLGNGYNFIYKYNHNFEEYHKARSINTAFKSSFVSYDKKEKTITISTDKAGTMIFNQYKNLDSLKVNLTSTYEVLENNADSFDGNVYTWDLSRSNNKNIFIKYKIPQVVKPKPDKEEDVQNISTKREEEEKKEYKFSLGTGILLVIGGTFGFIVLVVIISSVDRRKYR